MTLSGLQTNGSKVRDSDTLSESSNRTFSVHGGGSVVSSSGSKKATTESILAAKEQKAVRLAKISVISVLVFAVIAMAAITRNTISTAEYNNFKSQFVSYASEIISVSSENVNNSLSAIDSFGVTISAQALASKKTWPFVSVPQYEARVERAAKQISSTSIAFCPIIDETDRQEFEKKSRHNVRPIYEETMEYLGKNNSVDSFVNATQNEIFSYNDKYEKVREEGPGPWPVIWQTGPWLDLIPRVLIMQNLKSYPLIADAFETMLATRAATLSVVELSHRGIADSQIFHPIFEKVNANRKGQKIVGVLWAVLEWTNYFRNILPDGSGGVFVVMKSSCGGISMTYEVNGLHAKPLGMGDLHDIKYDDMEVSADFVTLESDVEVPEGRCPTELTLHIYPSDALMENYRTNKPRTYTCGVVAIFVFVTLVFGIYDYSVLRRQRKVMARVIKQDKIVSSLFPSTIKNRLYREDFLDDDPNKDNSSDLSSAPMADLFPSVTILFADIAGFTAWSSQREPAQVFMLLESIYLEFDRIANRSSVFKIETVGDCYVAAVGVPEPRGDHACVMAKFARECMHKVTAITRSLEVTLGPDTGDLEMRMGLNSGQVTGGVLRGERSRFQLFGDAVNTAGRMESTCIGNKIQLSDSTAGFLRKHGKGKWIRPRDEKISVKGKGEMQTYWLETKAESVRRESERFSNANPTASAKMASIMESSEELAGDKWEELALDGDEERATMTKSERLVEWNVDVLSKLLQQIMAARKTCQGCKQTVRSTEEEIGRGTTVLEEFKEIITLPKIGLDDLEKRRDPNSIELGPPVMSQLRHYIASIASMYRNNEFHNFEHASHVTASVRKLLSRIVSFDKISDKSLGAFDITDLVGHSYGITSDPLTQFAVVFTAVIHDVDHPGVPNTQLVKENVPIVSLYKEKSVAEQNSVDLAWKLLMDPKYEDLRACIYFNENELRRFRQLVVNTLMATDICDKELQALRKARWAKAFSEAPVDSTPEDDMNRKATIVIEHLIQASDVSHTMQHWHIYKQWNERFFMECYGAYCQGRADTNPSIGWYKGEIGFFDFYIIPLAKKLENCGVFGVSSHEYLNYALANRDEWAREGESIVKGYLETYDRLYKKKSSSVRSSLVTDQ